MDIFRDIDPITGKRLDDPSKGWVIMDSNYKIATFNMTNRDSLGRPKRKKERIAGEVVRENSHTLWVRLLNGDVIKRHKWFHKVVMERV